MHAVGIYLLYAAVVVRGVVRLDDMQHPGLVAALLALYGLMLFIESWWIPWRSSWPGSPLRSGGPPRQPWLLTAYLVLQCGLVVALLLNRAVQDFYALLFIPPSLLAVLAFGRRIGFLCIAAFVAAMAGPLLASQEGSAFGLAMVLNYGGLCFLFGGYSHQVRVAETARSDTLHTLEELQGAHRQLRGYATQREEMAAEQERYRLARELHDSVTQTMFSMNLTVQSARLLLNREPRAAAGQLERFEELAAGAMSEIQTLVAQLRPAPLAAEGLPAALRQLAVQRQLRDGLQVELDLDGERALPDAVTAGLYHIVQEALTNVAKHAGTRKVAVRLDLSGDLGCLEVEDRGQGFDPQAIRDQRGHLGLAGMAERAREIGWRLSIEASPGTGTRLRVQEEPAGGGP